MLLPCLALFFGHIIAGCDAFAPLQLQASRIAAIERAIRPTLRLANEGTIELQKSSDTEKKELSYRSVIKVIDETHYNDVTQTCTYLPDEEQVIESILGSLEDQPVLYKSHPTPVLNDETVRVLRSAARGYFEERGEDWGLRSVALDELLTSNDWEHGVNDALIEVIYPLIRSNFVRENSNLLLTVTSATIFVGGGYPGAAVTTTTLERDSGMFTAHIDLGVDTCEGSDGTRENKAMGGLFMESLVGDTLGGSSSAVVGPLTPGQLVVHNSIERTAAMIIPSDFHQIEAESKQQNNHLDLDNLTRREVMKTAENAVHYSLRMTLSLKNNIQQDKEDLEAPAEERSYRLRNFARFRAEDRLRYLTLAGIIDVDDHENHLWLGFDYSSRAKTEGGEVDISQCMSNINKAIFHLEKAAEICPTDARIPFQLGQALNERNNILRQVGDGANQSSGLAEVADAFRVSSELETVAVKLGVHGIHDLAICLNELATTLCKMGEFEQAIDVISRWAECGSIGSLLEPEDLLAIPAPANIPEFEWIKAGERNVAVKTFGETAVFDEDDIARIRNAADMRFAQANGAQTSRYSMQYEGNREAHLDDLCRNDPTLKIRIDNILNEKIYPLVREAFKDISDSEIPSGALSVYDSIFVRYNGDVARKAGRIGASQPLHQDGGIYSVNIALNDGFQGGGTFVEALAAGDDEAVLRPTKAGHALLHRTTERHAGAPTTSGIRDILVIFLTARLPETVVQNEHTYGVETGMRLQSMAKQLDREKCLHGLQLGRSCDPKNSEMSYWLGVHLLQGDSNDPTDERWDEICRGVETLERAVELNPADARARFHLGMAISTRHKYAMRTKRAHLLPPAADAASLMIQSFEEAIRLEKRCDEAGCKNGINLAASYLTLGEFMASLRKFDLATKYLSQIERTLSEAGDLNTPWAGDILETSHKIMSYCERENAKLTE